MSCIKKQVVLQKLRLPKDVLHIVKDFCFLRIKRVQREKKNAMLDVLNNQVHIDVWTMCGWNRHGDENAHNIIKCFFVYKKTVRKVVYGIYGAAEPETYFNTQICSKCGDFINPKSKEDNACKLMRHFHKRPYKKNYKDVNPFSRVQCKHDRLQATSQNF